MDLTPDTHAKFNFAPARLPKRLARRYNRRVQTALEFTKMHGLGNDFVVVDARELPALDWGAIARAMCDRHFGIGADQLLLAGRSERADISMRLFNTDGFEAEMCGNGIRCVGKFAFERGIVCRTDLTIETLGGVKKLQLAVSNDRVSGATVSMGVPHIVFAGKPITLAGGRESDCLELTAVDMGNPHVVAFTDSSVATYPLSLIGPQVEHHALFPRRTNFEIAHVDTRTAIQVRVWERSAGATLACGTGACAAVAAARLSGLVDDTVTVTLPGGALSIRWDGSGEIVMSGPAREVFEGRWPL